MESKPSASKIPEIRITSKDRPTSPESSSAAVTDSLTRELSEIESPKRGRLVLAVLAGAAIIGGLVYYSPGTKEIATAKLTENSAPLATTTPDIAQAVKPIETVAVNAAAPKLFFGYRNFRISAATAKDLDVWAERLQGDSHLTLEIDGHCDDRGSDAFNLRLGQKRASSVKAYLVARGISRDRLRTVSFGRSRPAASGHNARAWSQNRRVELHPDVALSLR